MIVPMLIAHAVISVSPRVGKKITFKIKDCGKNFDFEYFYMANRDTVMKLTTMRMMASFLSFEQALSKH